MRKLKNQKFLEHPSCGKTPSILPYPPNSVFLGFALNGFAKLLARAIFGIDRTVQNLILLDDFSKVLTN